MTSACLSLALLWTSLFMSDLSFPDFTQNIAGIATVDNVTLSEVTIGATNATLGSSLLSFETTAPSVISCSAGMQLFQSKTRAFVDVTLLPVQISVAKTPGDACLSDVAAVGACAFNVALDLVRTEPRNAVVESSWKLVKPTLEDLATKFVCETGLPFLVEEMQNHTLNPPATAPPLASAATPMQKSRLFRAMVNLMNNAPVFLGIDLGASFDSETMIRVSLSFPYGFRLGLGGPNELPPELQTMVKDLMRLLNDLELGDLLSQLSKLLPTVEDGLFSTDMPNPFSVSLAASLHDLRCEENDLLCSLPYTGGIVLQEMRAKGLGDMDRIITNDIGPLLAPLLSTSIDDIIAQLVNATEDGRFNLPTIGDKPAKTVPSVVVIVLSVIICVLLMVGTVLLTLWRHRRSPITFHDGTPVPLCRVLMEDIFLMSMIVLTAFGFTWSNTTIGASLSVGNEINVLSFSLWESTRNLYEANVKAFSVLVFIFSGVYPYVKLTAIVVCTLILQKPDLVILRVIDYFGKFSLLDSFGMLVMAGGLQFADIAEVKIHVGFHFFMLSTLLSIALGNYATRLWRRGTTIRQPSKFSEPIEDGSPKISSSDDGGEGMCQRLLRNKMRIALHLVHGAFIFACILPSWVVPCLGYSVSGVAHVLQPEDRQMTLFDFSKMNVLFFVTCVFTLGIAPILYATMFPKWSFLASWCASDALLLACVAGLMQVNQFVRFVLGNNMDALYSTDAHLLWPLIPLLISSIWQWILAIENTFKLTRSVRKLLAKNKAETMQ